MADVDAADGRLNHTYTSPTHSDMWLKACNKLGFNSVVVVGHPEYYPRFGFSSARAKGIDAPFHVPDDAFMVQELVPGALDGVKGYDKAS